MPINLRQPQGLTANTGASGVLTISGANTTYLYTAAQAYSIDGKKYTLAASAASTTPTTDVNTGAAFTALAADQGCVFVWGVNAAGTVQVAQGPVSSIDGTSDEFSAPDAPAFPFIPDTMCPQAYSIHQTSGTSSAWTFGTSNWNATGLTDIAVNVTTLPIRPPTDTTA